MYVREGYGSQTVSVCMSVIMPAATHLDINHIVQQNGCPG